MIAVVATVAGVVGGWFVVAVLLGIVIGKAIKLADGRAGAHGTAEIPAKQTRRAA